MKREITTTKDGSKTLYINELDESYHSKHGALQEAQHVFIKNGLNLCNTYEITILELGFGTGLNVLVTIDELLKSKIKYRINYYSLEKYPIKGQEIQDLDYGTLFENIEMKTIYQKIHEIEWEKEIEIIPNFNLKKIQADFFAIDQLNLPKVDLIYYDCFGSRIQPELWEKELFEKVNSTLKKGGLLTTYSAKGSVRRILQSLGYRVEKKQGPPGKREMINAWKEE